MDSKTYLGVSKKEITPPLGSHLYGYNPNIIGKSVKDPLYATAYVFSNDATKLVMISADVCAVNTQVTLSIREKICQALAIPVENITLSATHTHTGPNVSGGVGWGDLNDGYVKDIFIPQIVASALEADARSVAVKMGVAHGDSYVGVNRRELNDKFEIIFGQNPLGPFDPRMVVLSFKDEEDKVVGNMIYYGCHPTALGHVEMISRDWPGIMVDRMETVTGGITAFFNGCMGDAGPRISNGKTVGYTPYYGGDTGYAQELGGLAACDAVRIFRQITDYRDFTIESVSSTVRLPVKERISREEAEQGIAEIPETAVNWQARRRAYCIKVLEAIENNVPVEEVFEVPQTIQRIGNVAFVGAPFEMFQQTGFLIQKFAKLPYALLLSNTNGTYGIHLIL